MNTASIIRSCIARCFHNAFCPAFFFSGIHARDTGLNASELPPNAIKNAAIKRADFGYADRARVVANTGPNTPAAFITAVSIA